MEKKNIQLLVYALIFLTMLVLMFVAMMRSSE